MATSLATQAMLATAEKGLNKLLQMDPIALEQLAKLAGKVIAIQSTSPYYTFFVIITEQGLYFCSENDITPDSKITASTSALLQLLLSKNKQHLLDNSTVMLVGESTLAYSFCKLLDDLNPDWQYELSQWFGPAIAGIMITSVKTGTQQLQIGFHFIQQQLTSLVEKVTSSTLSNQSAPQNPVTGLLNSLQKKFRQF